MATKKSSGSAKSHSSHTKSGSGLAQAVADVAVEIGNAAKDIESSLKHMHKAGQKGAPVVDSAKRAGKVAIGAVRGTFERRKKIVNSLSACIRCTYLEFIYR